MAVLFSDCAGDSGLTGGSPIGASSWVPLAVTSPVNTGFPVELVLHLRDLLPECLLLSPASQSLDLKGSQFVFFHVVMG